MLGKLGNLFRGRPIHIAKTGALPDGEARTIDIGDPLAGGRQVVLCRVNGELHALDSKCPHEGGRIAPGPLIEGRYALCPLHNYRFDPRTGKAIDVSCSAAKTYRVQERDGDADLWV
jgi:nitrite reductase/ring-hydroxylating ferredoxin subunit